MPLSLGCQAGSPEPQAPDAPPSEAPSADRRRAFSPGSCAEAGGTALPIPGGELSDKNCASGASLGVIEPAVSGWTERGLCCAPVATEEGQGKACGARAGDTCGPKEFCDYVPGQYCGAADAQASCRNRPEMCAEIYQPVCGCDDKTYSSACHANAAGVGYQSTGECQKKE